MKKWLLIGLQFLLPILALAQDDPVANSSQRRKFVDSLTLEIDSLTLKSKSVIRKFIRTGNDFHPAFKTDRYTTDSLNVLIHVDSRVLSRADTTRTAYYFHKDSLIKAVVRTRLIGQRSEKTSVFYFKNNVPDFTIVDHSGQAYLIVETKGSTADFFIKEADEFLKRNKTF